jgi:hypothetical protein
MIRVIFFSVILLFSLSSCDEEPVNERIPFAFVNQDLNLNLIQYQDLRNLGGYVYIDEGPDAGYKGLIVFHEGNEIYRAFERACPFDPLAACDPIKVDDSGLYMIHNCCGSTFNFNGNPTSGPASLDLLQYNTYVDGIYLKITNN